MRYLFAIIVVALFSYPVRADVQPATNSSGTESLGNKLLDDLPSSPPVNGANAQPGVATQQPKTAPVAPAQAPSSAMVPLARVQQGMQNAQSLLAQPGADTHSGTIKLAGNVQQEVVSDLDKLIAELSKQCQCQSQGGECNKPPEPGQNGKPKPGKSGTAAGRGKAAARDSSDRLDRASTQPVDKGDVNELVKELWGHLPERSRAQMLQSFSDEFLPKYELEIEQYYRKLSEEQIAKPESR